MDYDDPETARQAAAALASVPTGKPTEGGLAEQAGFKVSTGATGDMNGGRSYGGVVGNAPGDVQAKEFEANRVVREARAAIVETGGMTMDELLELGMSDGGQVAQDAAIVRRQMGAMSGMQPQMGAPYGQQSLMEQQPQSFYNQTPPQYNQSMGDGWRVVQNQARLKSGKSITVYMVEDALTGMNTGTKYRLPQVAEKIARVLNVTQNVDDPRVQMVESTYKEHVALMRELRNAKKAGNPNRVSMIESKLQSVNTKLGL